MKINFLLTIISITSIFSLNTRLKVLQSNRKLDDSTMSCVGNAAVSLDSNRVNMIISIQTTNTTAEQSLLNNTNITRACITALTNLGVNARNNISTVAFSINPQYKTVYNETSKVYDQVFSGYQVSNTLSVKTTDTNSTGRIIDAVVKAGATISSVSFDVTDDVVKSAKIKLIKSAIDDCKNQFNDTLNQIGYKIDEYLSITIGDFEPDASNRQFQEFSLIKSDSSSAAVYPGQIQIKIKILTIIKIKKN